jgi:hypothetical protein
MKKVQASRKIDKIPNKTCINKIPNIKIKMDYLKLSQDLLLRNKYRRISSLEELLTINLNPVSIKLKGRQKNHNKTQILELQPIKN